MGKTLMIGSCEPFSGKSALVLGIAKRLKLLNIGVRFGKPLATSLELEAESIKKLPTIIDDDVRFIGSIIGLTEDQLISSIDLFASKTANNRLLDARLEPGEKFKILKNKLNDSFDGLNILEAAGSLHEGLTYGLSLGQLAEGLNANVILVHLWQDSRSLDALLAAQAQLGDHLIGIVLNHVLI